MNEPKSSAPQLKIDEPVELASPKLSEQVIEKPVVTSIEVKLKMNRFTCEQMFQRARFINGDFDQDDYAIVTEVIRPAKPGEHYTILHVPTGQKFCVDHYELDGVIL